MPTQRKRTYLICHTTEAKTNVAQAEYLTTSHAKAMALFRDQYPGRVVTATGVVGGE